MPKRESPMFPGSERWVFAREFLRHPLQLGSIIPSSRFLERRVVTAADVGSAALVVELGAGTGGMSRAILRAMAPAGRLASIELNPHLHKMLSRIDDRRLLAHRGNADALAEILAQYGLGAPQAIICGIPFSTMSRDSASRVMDAVTSCLAPGGYFVAYQLSHRVVSLSRPLLGREQTVTELRNMPPMRIFRWTKQPLGGSESRDSGVTVTPA